MLREARSDMQKQKIHTDKISSNALCSEELPYERFEKLGAESLTDSELLAIILRTGTKNCSALDLSKKVMSLGLHPRDGLLGLYDISIQQLMQIPGIGKVKAIKLKAIAELSMRLSKAVASYGLCVHSPSDVAGYYMERLRHLSTEHVVLCSIDSKGQIIRDKVMSNGSIRMSLVSPREIFLEAINAHASNLILLHNHPSGDPSPSDADCKITDSLTRLCKEMDIPLLDHIIIGDRCFYSFKENKRYHLEK